MGDAHATYPKCFSYSNGVHFASKIDTEIVFVVVQSLQHLNPSKRAIIEQDDGDWQVQASDGREFCARHAEGAVAHKTNDTFTWPGKGCTDRCRQGITQATMGARNYNGTSGTPGTELCRSERGHRAWIGDDDHIIWAMLPEGIHHTPWRNCDIIRCCSLSYFSPESRCMLCHCLCSPLTLRSDDIAFARDLQQCSKRLFKVATGCNGCWHIVAQLIWIYIELKHRDRLLGCRNCAVQRDQRLDFGAYAKDTIC